MFIVPIPRLRVNRLSDTTKNPQTAQIVTLDMLLSMSAQQTDGSGSGIKVSELFVCDRFPITGGSRVYRRGFEDGRAHAICEGSVDDISVAKIF